MVDQNSAAVKTHNLSKRYGHVLALQDLNLDIPYGCIHGLVGPNGAGKSTALKILSGISTPTEGVSTIAGFDVEDQPEMAKANLGYIPEESYGYDALTVQEFLGFVAKLYGVRSEVAEKRIRNYVKQFKLGEYLGRYIGELSRGYTHRVVLCSLFVHEPKVFLLDDPFNSLDPFSSWLLRKMLVEKRNEGRTIIIATHMLEIAERICESFTVLDHGVTIAQGALSELRLRLNLSSLEEIFLKLTADKKPIKREIL
ncbi:MAG: ABC transporter ATP-binding protein [Promethearchaeati archaeon SRVP18_Atabeyarchaeia-1]